MFASNRILSNKLQKNYLCSTYISTSLGDAQVRNFLQTFKRRFFANVVNDASQWVPPITFKVYRTSLLTILIIDNDIHLGHAAQDETKLAWIKDISDTHDDRDRETQDARIHD